MGWTSLLQFLFPGKSKPSYTTMDEFHDMDFAMQPNSLFDEEGLFVETGEVVGETAVVTAGKTLKPTGGPLPSRVKDQHTFDPDCDVLLNTSDYVVFIVIKFETGDGYATGFYIDERHILSAGHNFYDQTKKTSTIKSIRATTPGVAKVDFDKLFNGRLCTHSFKIVNNLYDPHNPKREHDIVLLECPNGVHGPKGITLSPALPPANAVVDVIGYPAFTVDDVYLVRKGYQLNDLPSALEAIKTLLPKHSLTVSRGTIEKAGAMISYQVSTIPGMSGSCLHHQGKVVGIHVGDSRTLGGSGCAVSFTNEKVQGLFKKANISELLFPQPDVKSVQS